VRILEIHACDDWLSCPLDSLDAIHTTHVALRKNSAWQEVVLGLDSIAVQFDPVHITPEQATDLFREQMLAPFNGATEKPQPIIVPVCYEDSFSPDRDWIAEKLGLSVEALIEWHSNLEFTVTMLGFMPGFAYLQCTEAVSDIGRLATPRQKVDAGSIGLIGDQSCIYSFTSPGGWPIIGRTPLKLFDTGKHPPALLSANQIVSFQPISKAEFDTLAAEHIK
jgi:inhibitor of KinA